MNKILSIAILFLFNSTFAMGLDKINPELFKYAKEAKVDFKDVKQLHDYLVKPTKTKREKAEIFFYWIAEHIEYDVIKAEQIENGEKAVKYNSIKEKKGVCADYSRLFKALCDLSGIECYFIVGYAKSIFHKKGTEIRATHAWNIVKLDNDFEFVDCTWGSGNVVDLSDGSEKYVKDMDTSQVFVNSNKFRNSHLSESPKWQLLEHPMSYKQFIDHADFSKIHKEEAKPFMFRDSIKYFNSVSEEFKPIQEKIDAFKFNPSYKNAFECGRNYELVAQSLTKGPFNLENIKKAKSYYETSKKWYVKSFKQLNNNSDKPDRTQIEFIKNVNKRIKYCDYRIRARE